MFLTILHLWLLPGMRSQARSRLMLAASSRSELVPFLLLYGLVPALLLCSHGSARASKLPDAGWGGLSMHRLGRSAPVQGTRPLASRRISTRSACRRPRQRTAGGEKRRAFVAASREIIAWARIVVSPIERARKARENACGPPVSSSQLDRIGTVLLYALVVC